MLYINGRCQPAMQYGSCAQGQDKMDTLYFLHLEITKYFLGPNTFRSTL